MAGDNKFGMKKKKKERNSSTTSLTNTSNSHL